MQPDGLEKAILEWIARHQPSLAHRLATADVVKREHTGAGRYVDLSTDACTEWDRPPVDGPHIVSPQLESDGGSLLWLSGGKPHCLEIYAFGDHFPEDLVQFELFDSDGPTSKEP